MEKIGKTLQIEFDGFSLFSRGDKKKLTAVQSKNCSCVNGVLQGGIGYDFYYDREGNIPRTALPYTAKAYYALEGWSDGEGSALRPYYFIVDEDGSVYQRSVVQDAYVNKGNLGTETRIVMAAAPNGEMKAVAVGANGAYCIDGEEWTAIEGFGEGAGVCFMKNRVFMAEKPCKLWYGNPEMPWDFTNSYDDGGYIYLPLNKGDIVDLIEYGDGLYIFFQRGIMRLKPDGLARNFQVTEIPYSGGEIFAKSAGICGTWIFFLSENGICRFDGKEVEQVGRFFEIMPRKNGVDCAHATVGEYYVLRYFDDRVWTARTVALHADGKDGYFLCNYVGMNESNRMPICSVGTTYSVLKLSGDLPSGEERTFMSERLNVGGAGKKHLKSVTIYGEGCLTFEVFDGAEWKAWQIEDLPMRTTLKIGIRAEEFQFRFVLDKETKVERITLEVESVEN